MAGVGQPGLPAQLVTTTRAGPQAAAFGVDHGGVA
jgi:hypothetical protein